MSQIALNTAAAQSVAYTTVASINGLDATQPIGRALYLLNVSSLAWVAQGIDDTVFTAVAATDLCSTVANHNLITGAPVQVSNAGGGLPAGLAAATTYFAIVVSDKTFKLATTRALALAGTQIDITTAGTGVQTMTTVAVAAGVGSAQIPAGALVLIDGSFGPKVSVVQDTAGGKMSITPVISVR